MISRGVGTPSGVGGHINLSNKVTARTRGKNIRLKFSWSLSHKIDTTKTEPISQYLTRAFCWCVMWANPNVELRGWPKAGEAGFWAVPLERRVGRY